jgi:alkylated DNA repair dioxygenase AlkB
LRAKIARWAGVDAEAFAMALINEYRPGTPIGWHRDAPQYDVVAGISLLSACRMKFRPYRSPAAPKASRRVATHEVVLAARSAYLMTQAARSAYEHHIPAVAALALLDHVSNAPLNRSRVRRLRVQAETRKNAWSRVTRPCHRSVKPDECRHRPVATLARRGRWMSVGMNR